MADTVTEIIFPSDFKIKITDIKDKTGESHTISDYTYIKVILADNQGGFYEAIYDANGTNKNTVVENNFLYILVQQYNLQGLLKIKICVKSADTAFDDGNWDSYGPFIDTNIKIVKK